MTSAYEEEWREPYTARTAMEEASRCLLCHNAPCSQECPARTDPGKFIRSIRFQNVEGAAETIRTNNALGSICARVCPTERYCEKGCSRSGIDRPIDIGGLQRYATDFEAALEMKILEAGEDTGKRVAIVGSGPGALQAAASLRIAGHAVDIYEKDELPGGVLQHGIPPFRLPDEVVASEIERIEGLGVTFLCGITVGDQTGEKPLSELLDAYDAVLLDVGYSAGTMLPVFEHEPKAELALDFLARVRGAQGNVVLPEDIVVIGGGDVAMDVSCTCKALGVKTVTDVIYEQSSEFVCSKKELASAQAMGVTLVDGYVPESCEDGKVTFRHRVIDSTLTISADLIILAVGQRPDVEHLGIDLGLVKNTMAEAGPTTSNPRVFVTGDLAQGDKTVVWAVRKGKEAAAAIDAALKKGGDR